MRLRVIALVAWVSCSLAGCAMGGWGSAQKESALGGNARVESTSGHIEGELLLADTSGVLLLREGEVVRVRWTTVRRLDVVQYPVSVVLSGSAPSTAQISQMQLASRYPFGLSDEQLQRLLATTGQKATREIR